VRAMQRHTVNRHAPKTESTMKHAAANRVSVTDDAAADVRWMQRTLGNQVVRQRAAACPAFSACPTGGACHPCPYRAQTKSIVSEPGDQYEQEADRIAEVVTSGREADAGRSMTASDEPLSQSERLGNEADTEAPHIPPSTASISTSISTLIVDDSVAQVEPGQMRKSEFLSLLQTAVSSTAEEALAGTDRTARDCPYIQFWFAFYSAQDTERVARAVRKYAPETAQASTASDVISAILRRVRRAVTLWARTGETTGVPEDLPTSMPGARPSHNGGGAPPASGNVFFKGRAGGAKTADDPEAIQSKLGAGSPLDNRSRSRMEAAFGHDFSRVRVHKDAGAAGLSAGLNARAFTVGSNIAFASGEYRPGTLVGDALIAHELAHVVQQGGATNSPMHKGGSEHNGLEEDADRSAVGAVVSLWSGIRSGIANIASNAMPRLRAGLRLQRCGDPAPRDPLMTTTSDVTPRTRGTCGEFSWYFNWVTNGRSGFLVQEIINTYNAKDCTGAADTSIAPTPHFYEAWGIDAKGKIDPEIVTPHGRVNDHWNRPARPDANGNPGSQGDWSITGKAYLTGSLDPAASFTVGAVPDAQQLRSTVTRPNNLGSPLLNHRAGGIWDCCNGANKHDPA
jgi:hypothetical protein